jgi:hypothetical protein
VLIRYVDNVFDAIDLLFGHRRDPSRARFHATRRDGFRKFNLDCSWQRCLRNSIAKPVRMEKIYAYQRLLQSERRAWAKSELKLKSTITEVNYKWSEPQVNVLQVKSLTVLTRSPSNGGRNRPEPLDFTHKKFTFTPGI